MASAQSYTVENMPGRRRRLPWRLPAFLLMLLLGAGLFWWSQPCCMVAGHYKGRIGNEFSNEKFQLILTLVQKGSLLTGSCEISNQLRSRVVVHRGSLSGTAQANGFSVSGLLDDGRTVYLEGAPKRTSDGVFLLGESWTRATGVSQRIGFRVEQQDGRVSPQDLGVKKARN